MVVAPRFGIEAGLPERHACAGAVHREGHGDHGLERDGVLDMSQREHEPFGRYDLAELTRLQKFRAIVGAKDDAPPAARIGRYLADGDLEPIRGKPGPKLGGVDPILENLLARSVIIDVNLEVLAWAHPSLSLPALSALLANDLSEALKSIDP